MKNYLILLLFALFLFAGLNVHAQSPDAIAIRVIPNKEHFSALKWYQEKGFVGSPQSILVDGYEAVRDGRTVYVNAANVVTGTLHTNIYLISYNQEAEKETEDIFGQILMHWKFNANLTTVGQCSRTIAQNCLLDSDCPLEEFCSSPKARTIRDTRRLADLADMKLSLASYSQKKKSYPKMSAGSYMQFKTLSTWPSWQKVLAQELNMNLPVDPVNKLGDCGDPRFQPITCWDENRKEFADSDLADPALNLPAGSKVFAYASRADGQTYMLCAVMESGYVSTVNGACSSATQEIRIESTKANNAPFFNSFTLPNAEIGKPYSGYIAADDPDGDSLTWTINTGGTAWSGWSGAPALRSTAAPKQKEIFAAIAGNLGSYTFSVRIDDGRGESNSVVIQNFTITVANNPPVITAGTITIPASTTYAVSYSAQAQDDPAPSLTLNQAPPAGLSPATVVTGNTIRLNITGFLSTSNGPIYPARDFARVLTATDSSGGTSQANFSIRVTNNRPNIIQPLNCPGQVRNGNAYAGCTIRANDIDNNLISSFTYTNLPPGMSGNNATGAISGNAGTAGNYAVNITATDEYGAVSVPAIFNLAVNTYCGDRLKQAPNTEGRGGPTNNGREDCDDRDGIALTTAQSSANRQYECTGACSLGSNCAGTCAFTGGWCGDGTVQAAHGEECEQVGSGGGSGSQYGCSSDCHWSGGYCGDRVVQSLQGEQCDTNGGGGTSALDQYACTSGCSWTGGWCGNGTIEAAEEDCDGTVGIATTPATSASNRQYSCNATCGFTGGWCGDNIKQATNGEQCDTSGGGGTSATDQWACTGGTCQWTGGFCGDGTCNAGFENCASCTVDCGPCCTDDCAAGATRCISNPTREICANFDSDPCVEWGPDDMTYLVNGIHTQTDCINNYGTVVSDGNCNLMCRMNGAACSALWSWYQGWSSTADQTFTGPFASYNNWACRSSDWCPFTQVTQYHTQFHNWSNNPAIESCWYQGSPGSTTSNPPFYVYDHTHPSQTACNTGPVTTNRIEIGCY